MKKTSLSYEKAVTLFMVDNFNKETFGKIDEIFGVELI